MRYPLSKFRYDSKKQHFEATRADLNNDFINSQFEIVNPNTGGRAHFYLQTIIPHEDGKIKAWNFRSSEGAFTATINNNSETSLF